MPRPSQSYRECGKGDASLFFSVAPGRPADDGHVDRARAGFSGSDDRPKAESGAAPLHDTDVSSSDAHGRTTSRCRPPHDSGRTRNGGNLDGASRPRPRQRPGLRRPTGAILIPWGVPPQASPAVGVSPMDQPPPVFHSPTHATRPWRAHARHDDADPWNQQTRSDRQHAALLSRR